MNGIAFTLAVVVLLPVLNRLRLINWATARAYAVLQYLLQGGVAFWALWDACTGTVGPIQFAVLAGVFLWLMLTRSDWAGDRMPDHIQTGPAPLGRPELERFK